MWQMFALQLLFEIKAVEEDGKGWKREIMKRKTKRKELQRSNGTHKKNDGKLIV